MTDEIVADSIVLVKKNPLPITIIDDLSVMESSLCFYIKKNKQALLSTIMRNS